MDSKSNPAVADPSAPTHADPERLRATGTHDERCPLISTFNGQETARKPATRRDDGGKVPSFGHERKPYKTMGLTMVCETMRSRQKNAALDSNQQPSVP